jgi:hypothetical protein
MFTYRLHYPEHFPDIKAAEALAEKTSGDINELKLEMRSGFKNLAGQASIEET